jgi:type IV secretory pathway VirB2 component (pilin)
MTVHLPYRGFRERLERRKYLLLATMLVLFTPRARAQGVGGSDIGTIADNFINYLGGAAGGYIAAAALMITALLWGIGILSGRHAVETTGAVVLAWGAAYLVRTTIGWA